MLAGCATDDAETAESQPVVTADDQQPLDSGNIRPDGRPDWFFPEPRVEDRRLLLCVEAFGEDVVAARQAATDRARDQLRLIADRRELALAGDTIDISRVWAWPLPGGGIPGKRYAGYAMASARFTQ